MSHLDQLIMFAVYAMGAWYWYDFGHKRGYAKGVNTAVDAMNKRRSTARHKAIEEIANRDNEQADRQLSGSQLDH